MAKVELSKTQFMKNSIKTLIFFLVIGLLPKISFSQINYALSVELGQVFAGVEKKSKIAEDFFIEEADNSISSQLSPMIALVHDFSFGENQRFGATLKMQFEQANFTRHSLSSYQNPNYEITRENIYQLNQLSLPIELFWKFGKFKISGGLVNNWSIRGKVSTSEGNTGQTYYNSNYETGKILGGSFYGIAGWSSDTSFEKIYSIQSSFGIDFQISDRWQIGANFNSFLTKNKIKADIFDYDIFYNLEFQHQTNSVSISLAYLLFEK